ncbi:MAG: hypothetical protein A4E57_04210 [Syntrophorhabdaceae bacterium PtaU1.Bin034]|jgi:hypothetical protein|nr:MAG: hypothetical protein A4E57_04210 [Syntrophorhabdaceae bacterium PtaU1.Bin034]
MEQNRAVFSSVLESQGISDYIHRIRIEAIDNPWNEKVLVKKKTADRLDVALRVWDNNLFLYGRIYRLFLYVYDLLNPDFNYQSVDVPKEDAEPERREHYVQVWSIFVDSRLERKSVPNFYDRALRRSIFVNALPRLSWNEAFRLFGELWNRSSYTHSDIVREATNLANYGRARKPATPTEPEVEIGSFLKDHSVSRHLDRVAPSRLNDLTRELLNSTVADHKDAVVRSCYYGIHVECRKRLVGEIIPMKERVSLTLIDSSQKRTTFEVTETCDLEPLQTAVQEAIRTYNDPSSPL